MESRRWHAQIEKSKHLAFPATPWNSGAFLPCSDKLQANVNCNAWRLWGSNPRPYGLAPEASALDHSAKPSWNSHPIAALIISWSASLAARMPTVRDAAWKWHTHTHDPPCEATVRLARRQAQPQNSALTAPTQRPVFQWISSGDHPIKMERRRWAWPLREGGTRKSRSVNIWR